VIECARDDVGLDEEDASKLQTQKVDGDALKGLAKDLKQAQLDLERCASLAVQPRC